MASKRTERPTIIVTGDVTIDWNVAQVTRLDADGRSWNAALRTRACGQPGGVCLLTELVAAATSDVAKEIEGVDLHSVTLPRGPRHPAETRFHHSYALWEPYPRDTRDMQLGCVWRVREFFGLDGSCEPPGNCEPLPLPDETPAQADLIVLDDAALGFRKKDEVWPEALESTEWILLKMAAPVAKGPLWERLLENEECLKRTVVVMSANDLRQTDVHISRELSWERTAQDLYWELTHNPSVHDLARCGHVVVSFGPAGAFMLSRLDADDAATPWEARLFIDGDTFEGGWGAHHPGSVIGQNCCLTASLSRQLIIDGAQPDMAQGIQTGIAAIRLLKEVGYGPQERGAADLKPPEFPVREIRDILIAGATPVVEATVANPVRFLHAQGPQDSKRRLWTILDDVCHQGGCRLGEGRHETLLDRACEIVRWGPQQALKQVPLGRFGALTTADRREIESFRTVRALIAEYCSGPRERPLSIAVFGPPGSGKSFGVKQVARSLGQGNIGDITFNLSQFNHPDELMQALHQVRDEVLTGRIPLVFWDEFDTTLDDQPWGWLRHFLAPMQDGNFQEGQITHPIGRAIFVFAGGTSTSMESFDRVPGQAQYEAFVAAKGPDFISRLKGYVNIIGPNEHVDTSLDSDEHFILRRAILLRGMLERHVPQIFPGGEGKGEARIDSGVLRAFLQIGKYCHGARSMEAIISMSMLAGQRSYARSALPSEAQLEVHVNGREFQSLAQAPLMEGDLLEKLAEAAHEVFRAEEQRKEKEDETPPAEQAAFPYDKLSEHYKEQNRDNVRDIPNKLAVIGCVMLPARGHQPPPGFPGADLELLAKMEHDRWLRQKATQGWRYGPERDENNMENPAMLPWVAMTREELVECYGEAVAAVMGTDELPENEKEKDRALVKGIPVILTHAGYTVAKLK